MKQRELRLPAPGDDEGADAYEVGGKEQRGAPYPTKVGSDGSAHHEKAQVDQKSDEEDLQGRFSRSQGLKGGKLSRRSKDQSRHENDLSQVEAVGLGGNPKSEGC